MISWDPQTHCITEWRVPGWAKPLRFIGWGGEVGNGFGYFAHERLGGAKFKIKDFQLRSDGSRSVGSSWLIDLPKAKLLRLELCNNLVTPDRIVRKLTLSNPSDKIPAWIGDVVLRVVVPWEEGLIAELEQKEISHRSTNFYYDTEEPSIALRWPDGRRLVVNWVQAPDFPPPLTPYLYVRDQPGMPQYHHRHCSEPAWVIHARMLVDYPAALVCRLWRNPLVLCNRTLLSRYVLRSLFGRYLLPTSSIRRLWRAGEWHPGKRWTLFGLWPLLPHQSWECSINIEASQ